MTPKPSTRPSQKKADEIEPILSDADANPLNGAQPTVFTAVDGIAGTPELDVQKRWFVGGDADNDGVIDPGDLINYAIVIANQGTARATNVVLTDCLS